MTETGLASKARAYLETLCSVRPNRRTGSAGNRAATAFFADTVRPFGYEIDTTPFDCLDWVCRSVELAAGGRSFELQASPYTLGCDVAAELAVVTTVDELEGAAFAGKVLLLRGDISAEQLMPKNFVFYNPEHHQRIIALLESKRPAALVTATGKNPALVGALDPYPLIFDGDFDIPSVFCGETEGEALSRFAGQPVELRIDAERIPATATNVIARRNPGADRKVVITAHIDAYEGSPGALDDGTGATALLLIAELLADYRGPLGVEIVSINGEDHYSAGGEMDYLRRYGSELPVVALAINIDDAGYWKGRTGYSFYECPGALSAQAAAVFDRYPGLIPGEPWYQGDHMVFVQNGVPCAALTDELMVEVMRQFTHTAADTPDLVDCNKVVEIAQAISALVREL
jgi:aminopeptidase YwaD